MAITLFSIVFISLNALVFCAILFMFFFEPKVSPIESYIEKSRIMGFSDRKIMERLLKDGWDKDAVYLLMRQ